MSDKPGDFYQDISRKLANADIANTAELAALRKASQEDVEVMRNHLAATSRLRIENEQLREEVAHLRKKLEQACFTQTVFGRTNL